MCVCVCVCVCVCACVRDRGRAPAREQVALAMGGACVLDSYGVLLKLALLAHWSFPALLDHWSNRLFSALIQLQATLSLAR